MSQSQKKWTWSNGDVCERSPRRKLQEQQQQQQQQQQQYKQQQQQQDNYRPLEQAEHAHSQALLSENDIWSIDEPVHINKREDTYNRISEREMICQTGQNPFMSENNYLKDLMVHDSFMKPQNTTDGREKRTDI